MHHLLALVLCASSLLASQTIAHACSCVAPFAPPLDPETCIFESSPEFAIPANHKGLPIGLWVDASARDTLGDYITLSRVGVGEDGETLEEVSFNLLSNENTDALTRALFVLPTGGLAVGQQYLLDLSVPRGELEQTCAYEQTARITVVEAPTGEPTLAAGPIQRGVLWFDADSACSSEEQAVFVDVEVSWPAPLEQISAVFDTRVYVDGEVYHYREHSCESSANVAPSRSTFRLAASCDTDYQFSLDEGSHQVTVRSYTNEGHEWISEPIEVSLYCSPPTDNEPGCSSSPRPRQPPSLPGLLVLLGLLGLTMLRQKDLLRALSGEDVFLEEPERENEGQQLLSLRSNKNIEPWHRRVVFQAHEDV